MKIILNYWNNYVTKLELDTSNGEVVETETPSVAHGFLLRKGKKWLSMWSNGEELMMASHLFDAQPVKNSEVKVKCYRFLFIKVYKLVCNGEEFYFDYQVPSITSLIDVTHDKLDEENENGLAFFSSVINGKYDRDYLVRKWS